MSQGGHEKRIPEGYARRCVSRVRPVPVAWEAMRGENHFYGQEDQEIKFQINE